ncbi:MAG: hypothetical protein ETSY2_09810 [Candidatus Entotheonella gemina]|uniref:Uncharacterized protein n=1 Tax=Candidatus Entotheonella gemina TaxID=1429439 RepID=W4MBE9_9BACT|nr:MAG: hypothetical protein ETSY2_09810 [Candidatus Entotheonella gemina]
MAPIRQKRRWWAWAAIAKQKLLETLAGVPHDYIIYLTLKDYRYAQSKPILFSVGCEVAKLAIVERHFKNGVWS